MWNAPKMSKLYFYIWLTSSISHNLHFCIEILLLVCLTISMFFSCFGPKIGFLNRTKTKTLETKVTLEFEDLFWKVLRLAMSAKTVYKLCKWLFWKHFSHLIFCGPTVCHTVHWIYILCKKNYLNSFSVCVLLEMYFPSKINHNAGLHFDGILWV